MKGLFRRPSELSEEWTEAEWRAAERRDPSKTYIEPEMLPFLEDPRGRGFLICLTLALIPLAGFGWLWDSTALPPGLPPDFFYH